MTPAERQRLSRKQRGLTGKVNIIKSKQRPKVLGGGSSSAPASGGLSFAPAPTATAATAAAAAAAHPAPKPAGDLPAAA